MQGAVWKMGSVAAGGQLSQSGEQQPGSETGQLLRFLGGVEVTVAGEMVGQAVGDGPEQGGISRAGSGSRAASMPSPDASRSRAACMRPMTSWACVASYSSNSGGYCPCWRVIRDYSFSSRPNTR